MVNLLLTLLVTSTSTSTTSRAEPVDPIAVVRVARGEVTVVERKSQAATSGRLLAPGATVELGPSAWAELLVRGDTRLRVSGDTRFKVVGPSRIRLSSGRVWVEVSRGSDAFEVVAPTHVTRVTSGSSVVIEYTAGSGSFATTRAGIALVVEDEVRELAVPRGYIARSHGESMQVKIGGGALSGLVSRETRAGLGDVLGLTAFILSYALGADLGPIDLRGVQEIVELDPEEMGGHYPTELVERSLRPPPFYENEVPPRGSNVEVEVRFEE